VGVKGSVDAAIAATTAKPVEQRATIAVHLPSGRQVLMQVPVDLTPVEALALTNYSSGPLLAKLAEARRPTPSILVPDRLARA
jgi:hypothetical protein